MNTINILGLDYVIERVPYISKEEWPMAKIDFIGQKILIDESLGEDKSNVALLHEVIHGICEGLGFHEENNNETFIQSLATSLCQCLKYNNAFLRG
jgi:hypothetical protein